MAREVKTTALSFRIRRELADRLQEATESSQIRLTKTAILERGLELVFQELSREFNAVSTRRAHRK